MPTPYRFLTQNREWLERRYVTEGRTIRQIAAEVGCGQTAIVGALRRHDIFRPGHEPPREPPPPPREPRDRDTYAIARDQAARDRRVFAGVRRRLEESRERGVPFDEAWPVALAGCGTCRAALADTRDSWERAYAGEAPVGYEAAPASCKVFAA
jgi:hypothetical protein